MLIHQWKKELQTVHLEMTSYLEMSSYLESLEVRKPDREVADTAAATITTTTGLYCHSQNR